MPLEWKEMYKFQHETIDTQHEKLFQLANKVEAFHPKTATKEEVTTAMKQFFNYIREHFTTEEAYMKHIAYPLLHEHKKLHEEIIDEFTHMLKETHRLEALIPQMKVASHHWLVEHILEHDQHIHTWNACHTIVLDDYA